MTRARSPVRIRQQLSVLSASYPSSASAWHKPVPLQMLQKVPRVPRHVAAGHTEWPPKPLSFCATHPKQKTARTTTSRTNRRRPARRWSCLPLASFQPYPHFSLTRQSSSNGVHEQLKNIATSPTDADHQVVTRFVPVGLLFIPII